MLPIERQKEIRKMLHKRKMLRISELSDQFNVSKMTIYRDVKPLIEEGLILRTPGGFSLVEDNQQASDNQNSCVYCHKPNQTKMSYRLILPQDKLETACCAHCGLLRHRQLLGDVSHAICHDFFMDTTISASSAWYVMETSLNVPCCQPQVLTFENKEHAEKFVKGFGGNVYGFQEAMEVVYEKMHGHDACCADA